MLINALAGAVSPTVQSLLKNVFGIGASSSAVQTTTSEIAVESVQNVAEDYIKEKLDRKNNE